MTPPRYPLSNPGRGHRHPKGKAVGDALRKTEGVGQEAAGGEGKRGTGSKPGLDLVQDEQRIVRVTPLAHTTKVTRRRDADAGLTLDRLEDDGTNALVEDRVERVQIVEGNVTEAFQHRAERITVLCLGGGGEGAERPAMVGTVGRDHPGPPAPRSRLIPRSAWSGMGLSVDPASAFTR